MKLFYWLISIFSVSGKESGIVRHWWVVRDIAVDPQWNLWQPIDLDRFGFYVKIYFQFSHIFSLERKQHKKIRGILQNFNSWMIKLTKKVPNEVKCCKIAQLFFRVRFSSWEENLRGLREKLKHKIRNIASCLAVMALSNGVIRMTNAYLNSCKSHAPPR